MPITVFLCLRGAIAVFIQFRKCDHILKIRNGDRVLSEVKNGDRCFFVFERGDHLLERV